MRVTPYALIFAAMSVASLEPGCHRHDHEHGHGHGDKHSHDKAHEHGHGPHAKDGHEHREGPNETRTSWGLTTQSFTEFPPLVLGQALSFAAHLTWAKDWSPVSSGTLTVVLSGGDAPEERYTSASPSQPGIFRPKGTPSYPVKRDIALEFEHEGSVERHVLGEVEVAASPKGVKAIAQEETLGKVPLLLEQQWNLDFRVAKSLRRPIRASLEVYGRVRELNDSVTTIKAPLGGRLMPAKTPFPGPGASLRRDEAIAKLLPMLDAAGADKSKLVRERDKARAEERWAKVEGKRLEALVAQGAASERKLAEVRLSAEQAKASRRAAERGLKQLAALQSPDGSETSALTIRAPHDGQVRQVHVRPGAFVGPNEALVDLVDPQRRILELDVPEAEAARLDKVQGAHIRVDGVEEGLNVGLDARIRAPLGVDEVRHTIPLWWRLSDNANRFPVGLAVQGQVWLGEGAEEVVVLGSALVQDAGLTLVYVQVDGENFIRRNVKTGARDGDYVAVLEGLEEGESVVVEGAYLLKLASLKDAAPSHGHTH